MGLAMIVTRTCPVVQRDGIGGTRHDVMAVGAIGTQSVDRCAKQLDRCAVDWKRSERVIAGSIALWERL